MGGRSDTPAAGGCKTEGACLASQTDKNSGGVVGSDGEHIDHPPDTTETGEDGGAAPEGEQGFAESAAASARLGDLKGSEAVKLLDEELAELELLMVLQRRKVDALERLRRQWLAGDRPLPDAPLDVPELSLRVGEVPIAHKDTQNVPDVGSQHWDMFPPMGGFEHYMIPHARIPLTSRVIAMEMLSFRLRGKSRSPASSANKYDGGGRSGALFYAHNRATHALNGDGFLTVLACLHADGVVRLHDTDGEEVLAFDAGHRKASSPTASHSEATIPVVVGLIGDASDGDPVLVTAGVDGTARVHSLTVRLRGKRVAGGRDGKNDKPRGSDGETSRQAKESRASPTTAEVADGSSGGAKGDEGKGSNGDRVLEGGRGGPSTSRSRTAMGVGITAEFRVCLGSACAEEVRAGPSGNRGAEALDGSAHETGATVTSMDAFYYRTLGATVVVAGYSKGGVRIFHGGNGTVLGSSDAENAVIAVRRSGQSIAYSDGSDVRFVNVGPFDQAPDRVCRGGWGTGGSGGGGIGDDGEAMVTSLAFDAASSAVLYVGYETGAVMAFNNKLQEVDGYYRCLPAYRLPLPQPPTSSFAAASAVPSDHSVLSRAGRDVAGDGVESEAISSVRGYAIVAQGSLLSVYNTTGQARLLFTRPHAAERNSECDWIGRSGGAANGREDFEHGVPLAQKWSVMSSAGSEALVVEATSCATELTVYKVVLPYERYGPDMSWMRVPILILGLFVVAITQVYSRRRAKTTFGTRKKGVKWRGDADDDDGMPFDDRDLGLDPDLVGLRRELDERRPGGREWERSSPNPLEGSSRRPAPSIEQYGDRWSQGGSD